jgi:enoyl-CoA hydratase/carnithine racemase
MQIALGADIRYIHPDTQLSVREVHWGLIPDMTGTLMLSRLVRPDIAKELVFTAKIGRGPWGEETPQFASK